MSRNVTFAKLDYAQDLARYPEARPANSPRAGIPRFAPPAYQLRRRREAILEREIDFASHRAARVEQTTLVLRHLKSFAPIQSFDNDIRALLIGGGGGWSR